MSRNLTALAAAFAFTALVASAPGAHAQAQSDMVAPGANPGAGMSGSSMPRGRAMAPAASGAMSSEMPATGMHHRRAMRERHAMRRQERADRRAANDPNGAYMGGGGVFERAPDGSLRPAM